MPEWNRPVLGYEILYLFIAVVAIVPALVLLRTALHRRRAALMKGLERLAVCLGASVIVVVILDLVLTAYPMLQASFVNRVVLWPSGDPSLVEDVSFGYLGRPNFEGESLFDPVKDADLVSFVSPGKMEDTGEKPLHLRVTHDRDGFANPEVPEKADVIIVGDSFAVGRGVPQGKHWVGILRDSLKDRIYNIALPGWGANRQYLALEKFGLSKNPRVVLWAFYEGNDIWDIGVFRDFRKFQAAKGLGWIDYTILKKRLPPRRFPYNRPVVRLLLHLAGLCNPAEQPSDENVKGFNPVRLRAGGKEKPHVILPWDYLQMSMTLESLDDWPSWRDTKNELEKAIRACKIKGATFVLIYIPTKSRVYLPLIEEQTDREAFYRFVAQGLTEDKRKGPEEFSGKLGENKSNIPKLMRGLCKPESAVFVNTTDALVEAAKKGEFPYFCYGTHFNEKGNEIVAKLILDCLRRDGLANPEK